MTALNPPPPSPYSFILGTQPIKPTHHKPISPAQIRAQDVQSPRHREKAPPGVDTRIHWDNEDDGWIGGNTSVSTQQQFKQEYQMLQKKFMDLFNTTSDSYYKFLGVPVNANIDEIKRAYKKLFKEYHPDITTLPPRAASEKFMKLGEIYDVLSHDEKRKFYDGLLAHGAASRVAEKMRIRIEDPYEQDVKNWKSIPDVVDRLGGKNMELSDQAKEALTLDVIAIIFSICCLIYVFFFKEPY